MFQDVYSISNDQLTKPIFGKHHAMLFNKISWNGFVAWNRIVRRPTGFPDR